MKQASNISLKEKIIKKIAVKKLISESIVKEVIDYQFKNIHKAMKQHNSVEISGFGTLIFLPKRAEKLSAQLDDARIRKENGEVLPRIVKDIPTLKEEVEFLNQKITNATTNKEHS